MSTPSFKYGNGVWATKEGSSLAYNDDNGHYKPLPFSVSRASSATRVNKQGLIEVVGNDRLRIDYSESANGVALLEPSRSNYIPYSEDFSNSSWVKNNCTIALNSTTSPDGTTNASLLTATANGGNMQYSNSLSNAERTMSIWIKSNSLTGAVYLYTADGGLTGDLLVTSEWQRYDVTSTGSGGNHRCTVRLQNSGDSVYVWGAQLEDGSYATSYIPTSGSTATRQADLVDNAGNSQVINSVEGAIYVNAYLQNTGAFKTMFRMTETNASTSNGIWIYGRSDNQIQSVLRLGGIDQMSIRSNTLPTEQYYKVALRYKASDFSLHINGFEVGVGTSGSTFSTDTLSSLGFVLASGSVNPYYGKAKAINVYQTALTDAELEYLTSYRSLAEMVTELNLNAL